MRKEVVMELITQIKELLAELESELEKQVTEERVSFSIAEFAAMTGLHPQTVWRHIKGGRLKANKIGSKYFIPADEIKRFAFSKRS